tara:strand:- start:646 stop:921 length:276 start_codon:yes stop_codon:yes gene_type:complete
MSFADLSAQAFLQVSLVGVFVFLMRNNAKQSETFNTKFDAVNTALAQLEDDVREELNSISDRLDKLTTILISSLTDDPKEAAGLMNNISKG